MRRSLFLTTSLGTILALSLTLSGAQDCASCEPARGPWGDGYGKGNVTICFQDPPDSSVITDNKENFKVGFNYWKNAAQAAGETLSFTYSEGKEPNNECDEDEVDVVVRQTELSGAFAFAGPDIGILIDPDWWLGAYAGKNQWLGAHEYGHVAGWRNVEIAGCANFTILHDTPQSSVGGLRCGDEAAVVKEFGGDACDIDPDSQECCAITPGGYWDGNSCIPYTPLMVVFGGERSLSTVDGGVQFAVVAGGPKIQSSWTRRDSNIAWVVLDRNRNGRIDDATELFSSTAPQPPSDSPNGFEALRMFDSTPDGWIDSRDAVYRSIRLWTDRNHDGISQTDELKSLQESGIARVSLEYRSTRRVDRAGNQWKYRARIVGDGELALWDLILQIRQ